MYVDMITWLDTYAKEADVTVTDGVIKLVCFSHLCEYALGDIVTKPLICVGEEGIISAPEKKEYLKKSNCSYYSYEISGEYCGSEIVKIGGIVLTINGELVPKDIINGEYIKFSVDRIDIL